MPVSACVFVLVTLLFIPAFSAGAAPRHSTTLAQEPGPTFRLPSGTIARSLAVATDGTIWFTGRYRLPDVALPPIRREREAVARLTARGRLTYFLLPRGQKVSTAEHGLTVGPEGDVWFGEGGAIGRLTPGGHLTRFTFGRRPPEVTSITVGPDADLWFTLGAEGGGPVRGAIGRMTPAGSVERFALPAGELPRQIVSGPDGALWFIATDAGGGTVGRISTGGERTHFGLPSGLSPRSIALGWDGHLWMSGIPGGGANELARVASSGEITMFPVPGSAQTGSIARGPEGDMWFSTDGRIDSISPEGAVGTPACLVHCEEEPLALATWPDGSLLYSAGLTTDHTGGGGSAQGSAEAALRHGGTIGHLPASTGTIPREDG